MSYKPYKGSQRYHARISKKQVNHPVVISDVDLKNNKMSGYQMTTSKAKTKSRTNFVKMKKNPNPNDSKDSFVDMNRTSYSIENYSRPFNNWDFAEDDINMFDTFNQINDLESQIKQLKTLVKNRNKK